ncbi:MAG: hypothetical protein SPL05_07085 [Eubacteriales bacterium]|nr:hypothetical protein [Eubacteriales bacterium]
MFKTYVDAFSIRELVEDFIKNPVDIYEQKPAGYKAIQELVASDGVPALLQNIGLVDANLSPEELLFSKQASILWDMVHALGVGKSLERQNREDFLETLADAIDFFGFHKEDDEQ